MQAASIQDRSSNSKLSRVMHDQFSEAKPLGVLTRIPPFVASTYVSIQATCPDSCRFKDGACFVQAGFPGATARKLDRAAEGMTGDEVIALEAQLIDRLLVTGGQDRPLRLHVGGDVSSTWGAEQLAAAAARYLERGGGPVWTYTHRWHEVPVKSWGAIVVWASCETLPEVRLAQALGYRVALTQKAFESNRLHMWADGFKVLPCPAETRGRTCVSCRLCLDRLPRKQIAIGFALHGQRTNKTRLPVVGSMQA